MNKQLSFLTILCLAGLGCTQSFAKAPEKAAIVKPAATVKKATVAPGSVLYASKVYLPSGDCEAIKKVSGLFV